MFEENKEICRRLVEEAYGKGNMKIVDESVALKCRLHDPVFPALQPGADNLKKHIRELRTAFPDLTCGCDDIIAERDEVVIHWTCRGTQRGTLLNHQPTNRAATVSGTTIHRMEGGKVVELWSDWNLQSLLDQLGLGMSEHESNKTLARRFVEELWNRKKPEIIGQLIANDYVLSTPNGLERGPGGLKQEYETFVTAFPDCRLQIEDMVCEGDIVVVRSTMSGTHNGRLGEMAPSGKPVKVPSVMFLRIANGKIVEERRFYDRLTTMQQIGAMPESATAARGRK